MISIPFSRYPEAAGIHMPVFTTRFRVEDEGLHQYDLGKNTEC